MWLRDNECNGGPFVVARNDYCFKFTTFNKSPSQVDYASVTFDGHDSEGGALVSVQLLNFKLPNLLQTEFINFYKSVLFTSARANIITDSLAILIISTAFSCISSAICLLTAQRFYNLAIPLSTFKL